MTNKDPVGEVLTVTLKGLGKGLKSAFYGVKKLTKPLPIIGLLLMVGITILSIKMKDNILSLETIMNKDIPVFIRYLIYWFLLLIPFFYLMILGKVGSKKVDEYTLIFKEIGFLGKDKKTPYFLNKKEDGKKTNFTFKSNIPIGEWKKARERLETGLDCSIRQIREGSGKKIVELVTVSSDYKIPEMIRWDDSYINDGDGVICVGESDLQQITFDLNRTPHVLAAGETGSGKSVILREILWQLISKGCKVYMIDFKGGVEFGKPYERFGEVITERERALKVLQMLVQENAERLKLFRDLEVKNLKEYNNKTGKNLCRIGVVIDEIAEMLDKTGVSKDEKEIFDLLIAAISTLSRLSRATGINLLFGVQRPDAKVLPGQIKNNIPVRISGHFADKAASEIVLGNTAAVDLPDIKGRFLFKLGNETIEFQSYYFDDEKDLKDVHITPGDMLTRNNDYRPQNISNSQDMPPKSKKLGLNFDFDE